MEKETTSVSETGTDMEGGKEQEEESRSSGSSRAEWWGALSQVSALTRSEERRVDTCLNK